MDANDPATDKHIPFNYSIDNFEEGKAKCKEALQDRFGLNKDGSPVFGMVSRMVGMKGFDLVQSVADGLVDRGIELVILGSGESQYENFFSELCARHPGRVGTYIGFEPALSQEIYAGADALLCRPRASPAAWPRWWPAVTARLPSCVRPAACGTPSTTAPWRRQWLHLCRLQCPRAVRGLLPRTGRLQRQAELAQPGASLHGVRLQLGRVRQELRGPLQRDRKPLVNHFSQQQKAARLSGAGRLFCSFLPGLFRKKRSFVEKRPCTLGKLCAILKRLLTISS